MTPEMTAEECIAFCDYLQPIITGSFGFIKTGGYFCHLPGLLLGMSADEMSFSIIRLPVIFNVSFAASPNEFIGLKDEDNKKNFLNLVYFVGSNIKMQRMIDYYNRYSTIESRCKRLYHEDNCANIESFSNKVSATDIDYINVSDGVFNYRIPASKAITPATKTDTVSLSIFEHEMPECGHLRTFRYLTYKKKFKLTIEYWGNIIVL